MEVSRKKGDRIIQGRLASPRQRRLWRDPEDLQKRLVAFLRVGGQRVKRRSAVGAAVEKRKDITVSEEVIKNLGPPNAGRIHLYVPDAVDPGATSRSSAGASGSDEFDLAAALAAGSGGSWPVAQEPTDAELDALLSAQPADESERFSADFTRIFGSPASQRVPGRGSGG
jgi:hypothetical protein